MPITQPRLKRNQARWVRFNSRTRNISASLEGSPGAPLRACGIVLAGLDFLEGKFRAGTECSPTHLIWCVLEGRVWCVTGSDRRAMDPGEIAFCPAGEPHWIELVREKARGVWFHLQDNEEWAFLKQKGVSIRSSPFAASLGALMAGYLAETRPPAQRDARIARGYAELLAWSLRREIEAERGGVLVHSFRPRLETLWREVEVDPSKNWTVERLASRLRVSGGYLHRLCRKEYGTGPMNLVARRRMALAQTLLTQTDLTLGSIAERTGYGTAYSFSHSFLRHTGIRPGEFRRSAFLRSAA